MLLQTQSDLIILLALAAAILLGLALMAGIVAVRRTLQGREFQALLVRAGRKIETLERRLFHVLNAIPVALVETDATGQFTFANKTAHQLLGYKDKTLTGLRFQAPDWGITYPDGRPIPPDLLPVARSLRGQTVRGFEHLIRPHDSRTKTRVSVTALPITNSRNEVIGATTALVALESASGEGIGDLNGIWRGQWFTSAPAAFFGLDQNGTIVDLNSAACTLLGLTRETALGRNWSACCVAESDLPRALDYLTTLAPDPAPDATPVTDDGPPCLSLSLKTAEGAAQAAIVSGWRVQTQDGAAQGLTVMALPVTLPDTALTPEDALMLADLHLAERARAALGVGIWYYDRASDALIEDEGMRRLIGRAEAGGPTLISATGQALMDKAFAQLKAGETDDLDLEFEVRLPDGKARLIALKGVAQNSGEARQLFGVALDITAYAESAAKPVTEAVPETLTDNQRYRDGVAYLSLRTRLGALENELQTLTRRKAELEAREARLDQALTEARRLEAAGRLSEQMAHDFGEMLRVMNAALEMIGRQSPDSDLKRLSDAALAAGRRGERLTQQLQGLMSPSDPQA